MWIQSEHSVLQCRVSSLLKTCDSERQYISSPCSFHALQSLNESAPSDMQQRKRLSSRPPYCRRPFKESVSCPHRGASGAEIHAENTKQVAHHYPCSFVLHRIFVDPLKKARTRRLIVSNHYEARFPLK